MNGDPELDYATEIARRCESFVRDVVIPYEKDERYTPHGPAEELVDELRSKARDAGVLTPHILPDGKFLTHRQTAVIFKKVGVSPLGPVACNVAAPDEGNIFLLEKIASPVQRTRFLLPLIEGRVRSAFLMTEPADQNGAGSDPSMLQTTAQRVGDHWIINGHKKFITGADGAAIGIIIAMSKEGACLFAVDLPKPEIQVVRKLETIDSSSVGGHAEIRITNLRVHESQLLGAVGEGLRYAQIRLAPARLTHCMRWYGACLRANEIATEYAMKRLAFGSALIDHEGVGFQLADNLIDLKTSELLIDWCAGVLDSGELGKLESSMTKVAVSEALMRVADRCVQVMGGGGLTKDSIVEQVFREIRAFRIYDGPSELHRWSLAKNIKRGYRPS